MILSMINIVFGLSHVSLFGQYANLKEPSCEKYNSELVRCGLDYKGDLTEIIVYNVFNELDTYIQNRCNRRARYDMCVNDLVLLKQNCSLSQQNENLIKIWEKIDQQMLNYVCQEGFTKGTFAKDNSRCWYIGVFQTLKLCSPKMVQAFLNHTWYEDIQQITCSDFENAEQCMRSKLPQYCYEKDTDVFATEISIIGKNVCKTQQSPKRSRRSTIPLRRFVREVGTIKMDKIEHKVKNLCVENGHSSEKMEETMTTLKTCLKEKAIFLVPKHIYLEQINKCASEPVKLLKSCLPEKYKYFPQLIFDLVKSLVSFLYDDFMIIGSELSACLPKLQSKESTDEYDECIAKITSNIQEELVDSKKKFCDNWIPINECHAKQIKKYCKASPELTRYETDFMKAIKEPCENN